MSRGSTTIRGVRIFYNVLYASSYPWRLSPVDILKIRFFLFRAAGTILLYVRRSSLRSLRSPSAVFSQSPYGSNLMLWTTAGQFYRTPMCSVVIFFFFLKIFTRIQFDPSSFVRSHVYSNSRAGETD